MHAVQYGMPYKCAVSCTRIVSCAERNRMHGSPSMEQSFKRAVVESDYAYVHLSGFRKLLLQLLVATARAF